MFRYLMTAILLTVITMAGSSRIFGQGSTRVPKEITQVILTTKNKNLFFMDKVSYYRHHNYVLRLKKGQKVEIENGWLDFDNTKYDQQGTFDQNAPGFKVVTPEGKVITPKQGKYVLTASKTGVYKVTVFPVYKVVNAIYLGKENRQDYFYKVFFNLL